jgi:hypothetical protein
VVTVNPATGAATGGAATDHIYLIALDPTSVPEPATFGLFAAGALAVAVARARGRG